MGVLISSLIGTFKGPPEYSGVGKGSLRVPLKGFVRAALTNSQLGITEVFLGFRMLITPCMTYLQNPMDLEVGLNTTPRSPEPGTQTLNRKSNGTPLRNPGNSCQNGGPYN